MLQAGVVDIRFVRPSFLGHPFFVGSVLAPDGAARFVVYGEPAGTRARVDTYSGGIAYTTGTSVVVAPARPMTMTIPCTAIGTFQLALD
ncbi:hypothetical protein CKO44_00355 [Rubrivivax gelatinosus]|uniref:Uncharacterized protein n=1 Tax=Rubrivivax gelatinosus TaxID=28068 RepID=A0ABS1DNJ2_RUBGE|nr:hypothetical protein [Rubrivivax gelatinosus]MBK1611921.1 hypothetical protein [Rubrivivax gelatinosus]MBK1711577.1 hypothetical protein [Rubrivivax gelatinosus]MBZ8143276.1 hypothetical protein [Rubrivivax gelatinosus]